MVEIFLSQENLRNPYARTRRIWTERYGHGKVPDRTTIRYNVAKFRDDLGIMEDRHILAERVWNAFKHLTIEY